VLKWSLGIEKEPTMRTKNRASVWLALLLAAFAAEARGAPERRDPGFRLFADLEAAIAEAKDRNIPLFVGLHKDH
jgi:hypothetical protein